MFFYGFSCLLLLLVIEWGFLWIWAPFYYRYGLKIRHFIVHLERSDITAAMVQEAVESSCSEWVGKYKCHRNRNTGEVPSLFFRGGQVALGGFRGLSPAVRGRIFVCSDQIDVCVYANLWPVLFGSFGLAVGMSVASLTVFGLVFGIFFFLIYVPGSFVMEYWRLRYLKKSLLELGSIQ